MHTDRIPRAYLSSSVRSTTGCVFSLIFRHLLIDPPDISHPMSPLYPPSSVFQQNTSSSYLCNAALFPIRVFQKQHRKAVLSPSNSRHPFALEMNLPAIFPAAMYFGPSRIMNWTSTLFSFRLIAFLRSGCIEASGCSTQTGSPLPDSARMRRAWNTALSRILHREGTLFPSFCQNISYRPSTPTTLPIKLQCFVLISDPNANPCSDAFILINVNPPSPEMPTCSSPFYKLDHIDFYVSGERGARNQQRTFQLNVCDRCQACRHDFREQVGR
jgi:hypothetical protein